MAFIIRVIVIFRHKPYSTRFGFAKYPILWYFSGLLDIRQALVAEAGVVEHGAAAASGEQAIVIPFFDDPSLFHDDDTVRGFDGGQAMGDLRMLVALVKAKPLKFG